MTVIKHTKNLGILTIRPIERKIAKEIIIKNHYSHKWSFGFGRINIGIFKDDFCDCLGVAAFGLMMNTQSHKSIFDDLEYGDIVELNRFWVDDCLGHNAESIFLGACWKILRADYPHIKAVQSFADGRLGCGTIYKATNFKYFGFHKSLFYENIFTGEVQHKIPMEDASTMKMAHLNRLWREGKFKPFIVNTYRYIYPLQNIKFKIKEKPYPEYSKGKQYLSNYHHNTRLIYRALCIAYISDMNDDFLVLKEWIEKNQTPEQIQSLMKIALDNKFILIRAQNNSVQYKIDELKKLFQRPNMSYDGY